MKVVKSRGGCLLGPWMLEAPSPGGHNATPRPDAQQRAPAQRTSCVMRVMLAWSVVHRWIMSNRRKQSAKVRWPAGDVERHEQLRRGATATAPFDLHLSADKAPCSNTACSSMDPSLLEVILSTSSTFSAVMPFSATSCLCN